MNVLKTNVFFQLLPLTLTSFLQCSFIHTNWYAHPPREYSSYQKFYETQSAKVNIENINLEIWSKSNPHGTWYGPVLFPVINIEPPILNYSNIQLNVSFLSTILKPNFKGNIQGKYFTITTNTGKKIQPNYLTSFQIVPEGYKSILKHFSDVPDNLTIHENILFEGNYMELKYTEIEWFEIQPNFETEGKEVIVPKLRFIPKRNSKYTPYTTPLFYAPVR
jgi:hypothetical protein